MFIFVCKATFLQLQEFNNCPEIPEYIISGYEAL